MTESAESAGKTDPDRNKRLAHWLGKRFIIFVAAWFVTEISSGLGLDSHPTSPFRPIVALLNVVPILWLVWVGVSHYRRMDEMQRKANLEAFVFTAAGMWVLTCLYHRLEQRGWSRVSALTGAGVVAVLVVLGGLPAYYRNK